MTSVCITGVTSFTGCWIARHFAEHGWTTFGFCSKPQGRYEGLQQKRLSMIENSVEIHFSLPAEGDALKDWIQHHKPDCWIHHHHYMSNYRSNDYDWNEFERTCLLPLEGLVAELATNGCRGIIYSGTFFEPSEGGSDRPTPTLYGQSKWVVWQKLQHLCHERKLLLSKVVIPDPVGPLENQDRLIPTLIDKARRGELFELRQPMAIGDHLPVFELATVYHELGKTLLAGNGRIVRPSGWRGTNHDWIAVINSELIVSRLGFRRVDINAIGGTAQDVVAGYENPISEAIAIDWRRLWDRYQQFSLVER